MPCLRPSLYELYATHALSLDWSLPGFAANGSEHGYGGRRATSGLYDTRRRSSPPSFCFLPRATQVLHLSGDMAAHGTFHNLEVHPHSVSKNFKAEPHINNHIPNVARGDQQGSYSTDNVHGLGPRRAPLFVTKTRKHPAGRSHYAFSKTSRILLPIPPSPQKSRTKIALNLEDTQTVGQPGSTNVTRRDEISRGPSPIRSQSQGITRRITCRPPGYAGTETSGKNESTSLVRCPRNTNWTGRWFRIKSNHDAGTNGKEGALKGTMRDEIKALLTHHPLHFFCASHRCSPIIPTFPMPSPQASPPPQELGPATRRLRAQGHRLQRLTLQRLQDVEKYCSGWSRPCEIEGVQSGVSLRSKGGRNTANLQDKTRHEIKPLHKTRRYTKKKTRQQDTTLHGRQHKVNLNPSQTVHPPTV